MELEESPTSPLLSLKESQVPPLQDVLPHRQTWPHAPQLFTSLERSTHWLPQIVPELRVQSVVETEGRHLSHGLLGLEAPAAYVVPPMMQPLQRPPAQSGQTWLDEAYEHAP